MRSFRIISTQVGTTLCSVEMIRRLKLVIIRAGYPTISRSQDMMFCSWNCAKAWNHEHSHAIIKQRTEDLIALEEERDGDDDNEHDAQREEDRDTDHYQEQEEYESNKARPNTAHT